MKKSLIAFMMLAVIGSSCQKQESIVEPQPEETQVVSFSVYAETDNATKATVAEGESSADFLWSETDALGIWVKRINDDSSEKDYFSYKASHATGAGTNSATFTASSSCKAPYILQFAAYPYESNANPALTSNPWISYKAEYTDYNSGDVFSPMLATIPGAPVVVPEGCNVGGVVFKHIGGMIKVVVDNIPAGANTMVFTANNDVMINGKVAVDHTTLTQEKILDGTWKAAEITGGTSSTTFKFENAEKSSKTFYVPVLAGTALTGGFKVAIKKDDILVEEKNFEKAYTVKRGKILRGVTFSMTKDLSAIEEADIVITATDLGISSYDSVEAIYSLGTYDFGVLQVMKSSTDLQFKRGAGYIKNITPINTIKTIKVAYKIYDDTKDYLNVTTSASESELIATVVDKVATYTFPDSAIDFNIAATSDATVYLTKIEIYLGDAIAIPTMATPTNVAASDVTHESVTISWTAVTGAEGYVVSYKDANDESAVPVKLAPTTETSVSVTGLSPETDYTFYVVAKASGAYDSAAATVAESTTAAPAGNLVVEVSFDGTCPTATPAIPSEAVASEAEYVINGFSWALYNSYYHSSSKVLWFAGGKNAYILTPSVEGKKLTKIVLDTSDGSSSASWTLSTNGTTVSATITPAGESTIAIPSENQSVGARFKITQTASQKNGRIKSIALTYEEEVI